MSECQNCGHEEGYLGGCCGVNAMTTCGSVAKQLEVERAGEAESVGTSKLNRVLLQILDTARHYALLELFRRKRFK